MPVDPVEFNQLKLDFAALVLRVEAIEDLLDATEEGSLRDRVADLESSTASLNQVSALKESLEDGIAANKDEIDALSSETNTLRNLCRALQRWRTDIRHELVFEKATGNGAKTLWTLSNEYDETSPFVVFQANLTLVNPTLITFSDPDNKQFTSSVALTDDVHVIYFKALPSGN